LIVISYRLSQSVFHLLRLIYIQKSRQRVNVSRFRPVELGAAHSVMLAQS
jgi:hypothetical protein